MALRRRRERARGKRLDGTSGQGRGSGSPHADPEIGPAVEITDERLDHRSPLPQAGVTREPIWVRPDARVQAAQPEFPADVDGAAGILSPGPERRVKA
jgi:hypothetical protein